MQTRTLRLPENFIHTLVNLPENGMGYQLVKIFLRSGEVLRRHKVLNSELLMLEENEHIKAADITRIELEQK